MDRYSSADLQMYLLKFTGSLTSHKTLLINDLYRENGVSDKKKPEIFIKPFIYYTFGAKTFR
jgi:hypothetical protein